MRLLKTILFAILDTVLAWFTPKWRREARMSAKAGRRFLHFYEDKLTDEERAAIRERLAHLDAALLAWDKEGSMRAANRLSSATAPFRGARRSGIGETAEALFVILVVFLGIRTYYAQPFRIPTGSMQPSLNGIVIHPVDEVPNLAVRMKDAILLGSSYVDEKADVRKTVTGFQQRQKWLLFTETVVTFDDNSQLSVPCAQGAVMEYFRSRNRARFTPTAGTPLATFEAGEPIIRARIDAGDMVVVNRMAYHFRKPRRGETFVFDTLGIEGIAANQGGDQSKGTHYIKRLCGLPGDTLTIEQPRLFVNGQPAREWQIQRVSERVAPYNAAGYVPLKQSDHPLAYITDRHGYTLSDDKENPDMREYAALGDNTVNSFDSRYWGPVRQYNVIGPAGASIWPFTSHWGLIP